MAPGEHLASIGAIFLWLLILQLASMIWERLFYTEEGLFKKKESSMPFRRTTILIKNAIWGLPAILFKRGEVTHPFGAIPQHYGIDPQNYSSPDL
jgi:hypothetical protein